MIKAPEKLIKRHAHLADQLTWQAVSTKLRCDRKYRIAFDLTLCYHCGTEHKTFVQAVPWSDTNTGLAVFILHEGNDTYITGMNILEEVPIGYRSKSCFGYQVPGEGTIVDMRGKRLRGFSLVTGETGIHALKAIFDDTQSEWIGNPKGEGKCQSIDFVLEDGLKGILGKFDVSCLPALLKRLHS